MFYCQLWFKKTKDMKLNNFLNWLCIGNYSRLVLDPVNITNSNFMVSIYLIYMSMNFDQTSSEKDSAKSVLGKSYIFDFPLILETSFLV